MKTLTYSIMAASLFLGWLGVVYTVKLMAQATQVMETATKG